MHRRRKNHRTLLASDVLNMFTLVFSSIYQSYLIIIWLKKTGETQAWIWQRLNRKLSDINSETTKALQVLKSFRSYFACSNQKHNVGNTEKHLGGQILNTHTPPKSMTFKDSLDVVLTPQSRQQRPLLLVITFITFTEVEKQKDIHQHPHERSGQNHLAVDKPPHCFAGSLAQAVRKGSSS